MENGCMAEEGVEDGLGSERIVVEDGLGSERIAW